jgi:ubiquinone/menaquinone biosynthesis C-methylase UbiE
MKRQFDPAVLEMMDRPQPVSSELERDLQRIRQLNYYFGSYSLILKFVRRWIRPGGRVRIVDLATGSGDIPRVIVDHARKIGTKIEIDALDRQPATLQIARKLSAGYPEISYIEANILEWESEEQYDIVLCSLALHHFSDHDARLATLP